METAYFSKNSAKESFQAQTNHKNHCLGQFSRTSKPIFYYKCWIKVEKCNLFNSLSMSQSPQIQKNGQKPARNIKKSHKRLQNIVKTIRFSCISRSAVRPLVFSVCFDPLCSCSGPVLANGSLYFYVTNVFLSFYTVLFSLVGAITVMDFTLSSR